jgi:uncharacterized protein (TIGR02145 family)
MKKILLNSVSILTVFAFFLMACSEKDGIQVSDDSPGLTSVVTYSPEFVTQNSANIRGSVDMDVAGRILETGIYFYSPGFPSFDSIGIPSYTVPEGAGIEEKILSSSVSEGDFHVFLTGLTPNTTYRYMAFATNDAGTFFGPEKTLVTSYGMVSDAEGNNYQTVKIGEQIWMRENLKTTIYEDRTCINGCYQLPDDSEFGKRYSWSGANRVIAGTKAEVSVGACPVGWHVPSDKEWQTLLTYTGISPDQFNDQLKSIEVIGYKQAGMLKDAGSDHWTNSEISNRTGFSVLPADICSVGMNQACFKTAFWTSTPGIFYGFQVESEKIVRGYNPSTECGFSVRCVKDIK